MAQPARFDVVIVGGGPAGLSAALMLGRCRRRVAVCDAGTPRNAVSRAAHGFFTRDGEDPRELLRLGREQLAIYDVVLIEGMATRIERSRSEFVVLLASGGQLVARRILLATGLVDQLPPVPGAQALYGSSVFHCPFCDGWELREQALAAYGMGDKGVEYALALKSWSDDVVLCTDGRRLSTRHVKRLAQHGIGVRSEPIATLAAEGGVLRRILFASGEPLERRALFFCLDTAQRSALPAALGVEFNSQGDVKTDRSAATSVPGLYVAGDASYDVNFIAVAVAEGVKAAVAIHRSLRSPDGVAEKRARAAR